MERWVAPASVAEGVGGQVVTAAAHATHPRLAHLWCDQGFQTGFVRWVEDLCGWTVTVVGKEADQQGFAVQPRRWVVERTFAWLGKQRRLAKDYEQLPTATEAWIDTTLIGLQANRIARASP